MKTYLSKGVLVGLSISAILLFFITASGVRLAQKYQQSPASLPSAGVIIEYFAALGIVGAVILAFTFSALWRHTIRERALLAKESESRKQTELLQDILTHDMRNYNQIAESNAEMLRDDLDASQIPLVDAIIKAINGSSDLIERTKMMSKIASGDGRHLKDVWLEDSINHSFSLVAKAYPAKTMVLSGPLESRSRVVADDLLDEVFTNVLSNAVKYTDGSQVPIDIKLDEIAGTDKKDDGKASKPRSFVKISIVDGGKGIPDEMKKRAFTRYLDSASGSGLGLSIVHALVVDRYGGKVSVSDRVRGDHAKGTSVEIWLPRA
jgi:signal transduction histidine kinase